MICVKSFKKAPDSGFLMNCERDLLMKNLEL